MFNGHPQITFVISVLRLFLFWLLLFLLPVFLSSLTQTVPHSAKIGFILMQQLCHILPAVMQGEPVIFFAKFYGQGNNKLTNKAAVFRLFGFFHSIPYIRIANESVIAPDYVLNQLILKGMNRTCDELSSEYDFKNEEAMVLLAVLKECFKNGGEDITIDLYPWAYKADKSGQIEMILDQPKSDQSDDELFCYLAEKGLEYIDKREKGGALWIVGGHELDDVMLACAELGYKFFYSEKGGRITKNLPGWYLRGKKQTSN